MSYILWPKGKGLKVNWAVNWELCVLAWLVYCNSLEDLPHYCRWCHNLAIHFPINPTITGGQDNKILELIYLRYRCRCSTWMEQSWLRTTSEIEELIFISPASHVTADSSYRCWRLWSKYVDRTTFSYDLYSNSQTIEMQSAVLQQRLNCRCMLFK